MFVLLRHPAGGLYHLSFGAPVDPIRSARALLDWILEDYPARVEHLWDLPPVSAQRELAALVLEEWPAGRRADALDCMRIYAAPDGAKAAVACLDDGDRRIRIAALRALGAMARFETGRHIRPFLASADAEERETAALALAKHGTVEAVATLEEAAARDPALSTAVARAHERRAVIESGRISDMVIPALKSGDFEELCIYSPFCYPQLTAVFLLASAPTPIRIRAGRVLGLARQRKAEAAALAVFRDPTADLALHLTAAWMFGRFYQRSALPDLWGELLGLEDPSGQHAAILVESIGRIGSARSFGVLLNHRDRLEDPASRQVVDAALLRISAPAAVEAELWSSTAEEIATYVVTDTGTLVTEGTQPLLREALASADPNRRGGAAFALGAGARTEGAALDPTLVDLRRLAEADPDEEVRRIAAWSLRHASRRAQLKRPPDDDPPGGGGRDA